MLKLGRGRGWANYETEKDVDTVILYSIPASLILCLFQPAI